MQRTLDIVFNPITDDLYNESKAIKRTLGEVSDQAKATAKSIDQLDESIDNAAASTKKMGSAGSGVSNALKDTENQAKKLADKYKDLGDKAGDVGARTGQLKGALGALGPGAEGAANAVMDVADAGEAALKSFAALGPVAIAIGAVIATLGAAYMVYAREQDQAKESAEQMKASQEALDTAHQTLKMSLIDLAEETGNLSTQQAAEARINATLEENVKDLTAANDADVKSKQAQIDKNTKMRNIVTMLLSPLSLVAKGMILGAKACTYLGVAMGGSEEAAQKQRAALDETFEVIKIFTEASARAVDYVVGWSDENAHLTTSIEKGNKATQDQIDLAEKDAEAKKELEAARQRNREKAEAEAKASRDAAEAKKQEAEAERELRKAEKERDDAQKERQKVLDIQYESIQNTKELSALVDGFYDPIVEGEDQWEAAVRKVRAEQEALNKQLTEQAAINVANGISNEEILDQKVELEKRAAAKIERIWADKADAEEAARKKELRASEIIARKIVNIRKKQGKEVSETAEEEKKEQLEAAGEVVTAVMEGMSEIGQAMQDYLSETTDALNEIDELQADLSDKEIDASQLKGEALVEAYKNGEVAAEDLSKSQKRFIGTVLKADEEALKKKEKRQRAVAMAGFVTDKAAAISAVVFNTAEAVTKALAKLGPIAGGAAAGALIAIAGAQTALIAAEKPSFASGVANYRPDAVDATLHTGESVLNTRATRMLGEDQVNQLNQGRSMGGTTDITSAIFLNDRLFEAQSVKARMKYGTEMNKASRRNRIGISSKRRG